MKRYVFLGVLCSSIAVAAACSSSSTNDTTTTQTDASQQKDSTTIDGSTSSTTDGSTTDSSANNPPGDASGDGSGPLTLTIDNYLAWCNVTVNGGSPNSGAQQSYPFSVGTQISLHGDTANAAAFYWGYWGNADDAGALTDGGMDTNMDLSFTMTTDVTLHACCPDIGQQLSQCTF